MARVKTYDAPHKGLRNALSQLSFLAGRTDYSDADDVAALYALGTDVFTLLTVHAHDENDVSLTELEKKYPGSSKHDVEDHEQIHRAQHALEELLLKIYNDSKAGIDASTEGEEFYLAFSEFQGRYLEHTAHEERITQALLWQYFTDEELNSFRGKVMAKLPPKTLLLWFRFIIPAQNHAERVGLLSGFKKMAPEAFFEEGMRVVKVTLSEAEFSSLRTALTT